MISRFIIGVLTACAMSAPAFGWGDAGHRMVCHVAWDNLQDKQRGEVKALLDVEGEAGFADACAWANHDRDEHPETKDWHVVYVPQDARNVDVSRDCPERTSCLIREIERNLQTVKSGAPREQRATALKFLAHFVGDIHEPLRVGFAEDRGGEAIPATFLGKATTMRAMWDEDILATDPQALESLRAAYQAYTPLDRLFVEWIETPPAAWAAESLWIMRTPATGYVGNPGGLVFDEVYVKQNMPVALDRIAKAGMRLGHVLNEALR
ncbi:MAG: S1/P1 nuclease [Proteobacteria bacterium]|nr:S1/P1 nuclease [Pseudomonadota bacterium]